MPALAEVLVRVTERRMARSGWKFRPWPREVKMNRKAGGGDQTRVWRESPPDIINRPSERTYRRRNLSESCTHTIRSQIWDDGKTVKLQHGSMSRLTKWSV